MADEIERTEMVQKLIDTLGDEGLRTTAWFDMA